MAPHLSFVCPAQHSIRPFWIGGKEEIESTSRKAKDQAQRFIEAPIRPDAARMMRRFGRI
jgi:hypothetical protein